MNSLNGFTPQTKLLKNKLLNLKGFFPKDLKLAGPGPQTKLVTYLLLKSQLIARRGLYCSLDEVATWFLTQDKRQFNTCRDVPVLGLYFGDEYTQQVHKYLLNHLISYRQEPRFTTIWATSIQTDHGVQAVYGVTLTQSVLGEWVNLPPDQLV